MPRTYMRISDRHPFEVYLLALAFLTSLLGAIGVTPAPASVKIALDPVAARIWALSLCIGCSVALLGIAWPRPRLGLSITGLILEQVGLTITGLAVLYYCIIAFWVAGWAGAIPVGTVVAFGLASVVQAWKIRRLLRIIEIEASR